MSSKRGAGTKIYRSFASVTALVLVFAACSAAPSAPVSNTEGLGSAPGVAGASGAGAQGGAGNMTAGTSAGGTGAAGGVNAAGMTAGGASSAGAGGTSAGSANGGAGLGGASNGGSAGIAGAPPNVPKPQSPTASWVYIDGYRLMVGKRASDGSLANPTPFKLKGVCWSPAGIGESNSNGYAKLYTSHAAADVPLIVGLHANAVKTYDPFERTAQGTAVLDKLYASGVMVVMQVMASKFTPPSDAAATVNYFKGHPAIIGWLLGNEFNYNNLYGAANFDQAVSQVNSAISAIHAADPDHPVMVSYGELPNATDYGRIPADIWAVNLYPNLDLASRFTAWAKLSKKPLMVGEYGADAFNNAKNAEDQASQASATTTLTTQITQHYSALAVDADHTVLGGTIYSLSDEWWKSGNANNHDNGGMAGNIFPDNYANEEWWGLTTVQGQPRQAYTALANIYSAN